MAFITKPRTLSKSRFVMGVQCPQKLIYAAAPDTYRNLNNENSFDVTSRRRLSGRELAKAHFPNGHDVTTLDQAQALAETGALLQQENVVIFEAAIQFDNCFIRVDVLEKLGNCLRIHEVKAKSYDSSEERPFLKNDGLPKATWQSYCYDVAFQKWVVSQAFPNSNVTAYLMLVDKNAICPVDGLNQCFRIIREEKRTLAEQVGEIPQQVIDAKMLRSIPVDDICDAIYDANDHGKRHQGSFAHLVQELSNICAGTQEPRIQMQGDCKDCEFQCAAPADSMTSGFDTCLSQAFPGVTLDQGATIFDLWDYRRKDKLIAQGQLKLTQINEDDIGPQAHEPPLSGEGVCRQQRQWLQVKKAQANDPSPWLDKAAWHTEMSGWTYPLHFIDFETTRVALPFFKGQKPYQSIAFQFSHHQLQENGQLAHAHQFLCAQASENPNVSFVRALKAAIGDDAGTVFMYSHHENTTLRDILFEIWEDTEPDTDELKAFLMSLVQPSKDSRRQWTPSRPMVDQLELVKSHLYLPATCGSQLTQACVTRYFERQRRAKSKIQRAHLWQAKSHLQLKTLTPARG